MKRRIISIVMALALCLGLLPAPARAAASYTTRLDFTNVGDGEGQTPASGDGYAWEGDAQNGYTLTLNGITINVPNEVPVPPPFATQARRGAIYLPTDGPVTIVLIGQNSLTVENGDGIYCDGGLGITVQGTGSLTTETSGEVVANRTKGDVVIKDVTIQANAPGCGFVTRGGGNIVFENANITINSQGTNCPVVFAQSGDISIKNSTVTVLCTKHPTYGGGHAIYAAQDIIIESGSVTASTDETGSAAIAAGQNLTISGGAKIAATASGDSGFGLYSGGAMELSQSEIVAAGTTAAVRFIGGLTLKGIAILEPSDGKIGANAISNGDDTNAASAKLAPVSLNVPASPLACTYGDPSVSVTLTATPQVASAVEIYSGAAKIGEGNLGEAITIDTGRLPAGDITLTAKLPNELGEKDFTVTVKPKPLTVTGAAAAGRAYDGTREVAITAVTLDGVVSGDDVSVDCSNLKGAISGAGVGNYDSVTLPEMTLTGAAAENYTLTQPTGAVTTSVAISKGPYAGTKTANASAKFGATGHCDLSALLEGIDGAAAGTPTASGDIFEGTPAVSGKTLSYTLKAEAVVDGTGTITVPVTSANYENFDLIITVTVTDKFVPTLTVSPITVTYTGEAVPANAIKGTATYEGKTIPGTWSFVGAPISVADSGAKVIKFTPDEAHAAEYAEVQATVTVTINKATPAGAPTYTAISAGGKTLADAGLTAPADWPEGVLSWNLPEDTEVTANTMYEWTFTPADITNYEHLGGVITLWRRSTGGGGGGASQTTPPVSTTGQGSSTTTTTTTAVPTASVSGGTATAAVDTSMGNEMVKQAAANDSETVVIAPKVTGDVSKTEVSIPASTVGQIGSQTGASLTVSTPVADVTIPNGGLGSLASAGGTVTVTAEQAENRVELTVTAGGKAVERVPGGLTLTVPEENTTPGTVAVLIREDGTREVVRKSVAEDGSVTIPLDGSAKLEIVDNSRRFTDVPATGWKAEAAAFVSSHELFNGTAPGKFSPDAPMSRGMLAVVLHNLENNPAQALTGAFGDVDNSQWYAEGVAWAEENGIVNGYGNGQFGPGDSITREQAAVMLWRYAGSPAAMDRELRFADADEASDWAVDALCWATENGILNGKAGGILDPAGQATRAEAAQMLKNFMERQ